MFNDASNLPSSRATMFPYDNGDVSSLVDKIDYYRRLICFVVRCTIGLAHGINRLAVTREM
jgi:hypothetical protein